MTFHFVINLSKQDATAGALAVGPQRSVVRVRPYRLFCYDGAGRILSANWLVAANDDAAVAAANDVDKGTRREIWDRNRLVGRIAAA